MKILNTFFQGKKIRYSDEGQGEVVVLLHGFIERIEIWDNLSRQLSQQHRVICIELPGHGESELIASNQTMELMAEMVHEILEKIAVQEVVMIGHSMGGYVALSFAEKYPIVLKGLGLFHSHALEDSADAKLGRERAIEIIKLNREGFIFNFIPDLFANCNRELFANDIEVLKEGAKMLSADALVACLQGMKQREDKLMLLMDIDVPVMFIAGKEDGRVPLNALMAQSVIPKHSEILILGDCGHMGYIEKEKETTAFITQFVGNCYK
jgi:pimeloyl-ACP methyl ester carboxylesterase